jgi:hypothetical protein
MNPELVKILAACTVVLPTVTGLIIGLRIGRRRGWAARGLEDELGPQDDDAPWPLPEPVTAPIAAITRPGEMFREADRAPRHAATMARREIAFGGDFPHPGRIYRPYTYPIDRERLPLETDTHWMERITDEFMVRHGLNP